MKAINKYIRFLKESNNIKSKVINSANILIVAGLLDNVFRFARNIILARLLAPDAFGLMATLMAVVASIEALADVGLKNSVIQSKRGAQQEFLNIIWWISTLRGLLLYAIAFAVAPTIGTFYNRPDSVEILRVGTIVIFINGILSPKLYTLEKDLDFKYWVYIIQGSSIVGVLITLGLTIYFQNVWALVFGLIAESIIKCTLTHIFYPIKHTFSIDRGIYLEIKQFMHRSFGLPILMMIFYHADVFVIGRVLTFEQLGLYAIARSLADMPITIVSKVIQPVLLPAFSKIQDNKNKITDLFLIITDAFFLFGLPFIVCIVIYSEQLLSILYGSQYSIVYIPFSVLCISSLIVLCTSVVMNIFISAGRPDMQRVAAAFRTIVMLLLIYPATILFGLTGTSLTILIAVSISFIVQLRYLSRLASIKLKDYQGSWLLGIKISIIVLVSNILVKMMVDEKMYLSIIGATVICGMAWIFAFVHFKEKYMRVIS